MTPSSGASTPVAIVGLGAWYPGARTPLELWENVLARRRQFRRFPDRRLPLADYHDPAPRAPDKTYATRGAFIDGFEFDWVGRRIPQKTYESTDVVHWLALEVALAALEDAGLGPESVPAARSAVLVGNSLTGEITRARYMRLRWPFVRRSLRAAAASKGVSPTVAGELEESMEELYKSVFPPVTEDTLAGVLSNTIAGRICNFLDFQGGGYTVDGACASGLIAVATATNALSKGEVDFALAGGVDISLDAMELIGFAKVGALTRDDMNVYDRRGSGFIPGEGCGFVALKRLEDARAAGDDVYATIRGWGISSDGRGGITAPRADSQAEMIRRAYDRAGYGARTIAFVEGHGTGTVAGDKAELEGIHLALGSEDGQAEPRSIGMTSFKSLVGHTKAASGIAGLIKATIAVNRRILPPFAGCSDPNKVFGTAQALFPLLSGEQRRPDEPMRAGVSAMGFGGINCHVALETADPPSPKLEPSVEERALMASHQQTELLVFGGASAGELASRVQALRGDAAGMSLAELTDLAASLAPPAPGPFRAAVVAGSPEELGERLEELETLLREPPAPGGLAAPTPDVVLANAVSQPLGFLFPGQGSQQLEMGRVLVERYDWARELVAQADGWLAEAGATPVGETMFRRPERAQDAAQAREWNEKLARTEIAQPAICLASLLWLGRLRRLGVRPAVVAGHSLGELTAFHAAGAFDERTLIRLAALRGEAMAAPAGEEGAMASLACPREVAEELVRRAGAAGYIAVANVNSPQQTVVSGERAAIEEAGRLAEADGIQFVPLPVSNAFHSRLVAAAAERLRGEADVPERLGETGVELFSGVGGRRLEPGTPLREHFADQVVSQVDFVGLVEQLASRCELFVEVGPGRVLSGLVGAIGPTCLPVASRPGADADTNRVLAAAFVRGHELDWQALYERRLVRPFVPAAELRFIESPLEQPFDVDGDGVTPTSAAAGLPALPGLPGEVLADYVRRRGAFLAGVIRADLESAGTVVAPADGDGSRAPLPETTPAHPPAGGATTSVRARLIELAAAATGFPAETITGEARLLDDLNLDSIKAGELVATAAQELGATEALDPAELANATIDEVADAIRSAAGGAAGPAAAGPDPSALLIEIVARHTGFPPETLSPELRLLDDLNLDSIKAAEVVAEAAQASGIEGDLDPAELANATLGEVVERLRGAAGGASAPRGAAEVDPLAGRPSWVRDFAVSYLETDPPPQPPDLSGARAVVLAEPEQAEVAAAIAGALAGQGAQASTVSFDDDAALADEEVTHAIAVLPEPAPELSAEGTFRAAARLRALGTASATTHAYVQFGGFDRTGSIESCCAAAFAAGVHHERPELTVRVLDLPSGTESAVAAQRLLAELGATEAYTLAGYDAGGARRVPVPRVLEPATYAPRSLEWSEEDVVLVTGGGKGITAECALALARATRARMALVGRTAPPAADDTDGEVARTLGRFAAEGLTCRYYACDVGDADAVTALVARVREELGAVTAVVHGSGLNTPRRLEHVPLEAAQAELTPKVIGALNLCGALADAPPKLVVGLSSIIGVTGMPGNTWYGFANEALDLTLRRFQARHPETHVLSQAFSVWGEVGMGARMGSADHLARMGVAAIPTDEGVRRFLQLVLRDPGETQVVVAGRLRGLDTWRPVRARQPAADRFLEHLVHEEPGVEVVARARLTPERDTYLADHVYKGTQLLPTVFGLEAMAQAVAQAVGVERFGRVRIEDVELERPVIADGEGVEIEVRAEVLEQTTPDGEVRVRAAVGCEQSGFARAHFSATFVLGASEEPAPEPIDLPREPLDIRPRDDLYGRLLFQGPAFQRLERIWSLDETSCVFEAEQRAYEPDEFLLGDPYFRDALLQAPQVIVPQDLCLPLRIGSIELDPSAAAGAGRRLGVGVKQEQDEKHVRGFVFAVDYDGRVLERLERYETRILEHRPDNPTPAQLADPSARDDLLVRRELAERAGALGVTAPEAALAYLAGLHELDREERHRRELPLFETVVGRHLENGGSAT